MLVVARRRSKWGVIDVLVQTTRDKEVAERLLRKLIKKQKGLPRAIITDKLRSYAAATRALGIIREHRQHKGLNKSRREFASADARSRKGHATIQINSPTATVLFDTRSDQQSIPALSLPP